MLDEFYEIVNYVPSSTPGISNQLKNELELYSATIMNEF
jgi:hypothetical protein